MSEGVKRKSGLTAKAVTHRHRQLGTLPRVQLLPATAIMHGIQGRVLRRTASNAPELPSFRQGLRQPAS